MGANRDGFYHLRARAFANPRKVYVLGKGTLCRGNREEIFIEDPRAKMPVRDDCMSEMDELLFALNIFTESVACDGFFSAPKRIPIRRMRI